MSRSLKSFWIALGVGLFGLFLSIPPFSMALQERLGLKLLFYLRGSRPPPSDVIIVAMDRESIDDLSLSRKIKDWPRTLHGQLVQTLSRCGAKIIIFDVLFDEAHDIATDDAFAAAVSESQKVVLTAAIRHEKITLGNSDGKYMVDVNVETLVSPLPSLSRSAVAVAPFPLPRVPAQLSQYWAFKAGAGNLPTLPVVAYMIYTAPVYAHFARHFNLSRPDYLPSIPARWQELISEGSLVDTSVAIRDAFKQDPAIAADMRAPLFSEEVANLTADQRQSLGRLIGLFQGNDSRHLNFYGPAGTFPSVAYSKVLNSLNRQGGAKTCQMDFTDKVVFVGVSEKSWAQRQDGYRTVFSQKNGIDISGVEIAATAFANLLEDRPITPLKGSLHLLAVFVFGLIQGLTCAVLPAGIATLCVLSIGCIYVIVAIAYFNNLSLWLPVAIPLFALMPLAMLGTLVCRYCVATREREAMRKAFGYYLPDPVVDQLSKNVGHLDAHNQVVYGICLCTDAQQYASLSESMEPRDLSRFMNNYYKALFVPVKKYGGIVSDVVGDSMMAIWVNSTPSEALRTAACKAALEIVEAIRAFNQAQDSVALHTRIGMHAGHILVGNIGAVDHYEYRPVGDIVNTASRMEGMNKYLGTQLLVSDQVLHRVKGLLTRPLGVFQLHGKAKTVAIHELLGLPKRPAPSNRPFSAVSSRDCRPSIRNSGMRPSRHSAERWPYIGPMGRPFSI
jgi:adenylate cyclase